MPRDFDTKELRNLANKWEQAAEELWAYARDFNEETGAGMSDLEIAAGHLEAASGSLDDAVTFIRYAAKAVQDAS